MFSLLFQLPDTAGRTGLRSGRARARYFVFHHIPITPIGGPGPGLGPVFLSFIVYPSLLSAGPGPARVRCCMFHHILSAGPGPARAQVFYLSSYTHHSYRRARARPGPGILSFIYPSLLLADILSFITIYLLLPSAIRRMGNT